MSQAKPQILTINFTKMLNCVRALSMAKKIQLPICEVQHWASALVSGSFALL